jgi:hypothetical protein
MSVSARHGENQTGRVHVDAYDQRRSGQMVDVRDHERSWPGSGAPLAQASAERQKIKIEEVKVPAAQTRHKEQMFKNRLDLLEVSEAQKRLIIRIITAETSRDLASARTSNAEKRQLIVSLLNVMANRVGATTFPKSLDDVLAQSRAFANSDPTNRLFFQTERPAQLGYADRMAYEMVQQVVDETLSNPSNDPTGGATYFHRGDPADNLGSWFDRQVKSGALKRAPSSAVMGWRFFTDERNKPPKK